MRHWCQHWPLLFTSLASVSLRVLASEGPGGEGWAVAAGGDIKPLLRSGRDDARLLQDQQEPDTPAPLDQPARETLPQGSSTFAPLPTEAPTPAPLPPPRCASTCWIPRVPWRTKCQPGFFDPANAIELGGCRDCRQCKQNISDYNSAFGCVPHDKQLDASAVLFKFQPKLNESTEESGIRVVRADDTTQPGNTRIQFRGRNLQFLVIGNEPTVQQFSRDFIPGIFYRLELVYRKKSDTSVEASGNSAGSVTLTVRATKHAGYSTETLQYGVANTLHVTNGHLGCEADVSAGLHDKNFGGRIVNFKIESLPATTPAATATSVLQRTSAQQSQEEEKALLQEQGVHKWSALAGERLPVGALSKGFAASQLLQTG